MYYVLASLVWLQYTFFTLSHIILVLEYFTVLCIFLSFEGERKFES